MKADVRPYYDRRTKARARKGRFVIFPKRESLIYLRERHTSDARMCSNRPSERVLETNVNIIIPAALSDKHNEKQLLLVVSFAYLPHPLSSYVNESEVQQLSRLIIR